MNDQGPAPPVPSAPPEVSQSVGLGILYALGAFSMWGLIVPLHFKFLATVSALEIFSQRVIWATLFALGLIALTRRTRSLISIFTEFRRLTLLCLSASLVGTNWLIYIWAVNSDQLVQASLGYFINPIVSVALGVLFLGERLNAGQIFACSLATMSVLSLALASDGVPWVSLALALTFGLYGLIRKIILVDPLVGFCVESIVLTPFAFACVAALTYHGTTVAFRGQRTVDILLILTGLSTAAPLIWFAAATRRLNLSTIGLLQYIAPTGQLALGVIVFREPFRWVDGFAFVTIWAALAIYTASALSHPAKG